MKRTLATLLLAVFACTLSYAQQGPVKRTEEYCEVRTTEMTFRSKKIAYVDYGEGDEVLKDEQGKKTEFSSTVGVLNYMNSKGWELVATRVVVNDGDSYTYFIMKRKVK